MSKPYCELSEDGKRLLSLRLDAPVELTCEGEVIFRGPIGELVRRMTTKQEIAWDVAFDGAASG